MINTHGVPKLVPQTQALDLRADSLSNKPKSPRLIRLVTRLTRDNYGT